VARLANRAEIASGAITVMRRKSNDSDSDGRGHKS
jgi:hypothetical protein